MPHYSQTNRPLQIITPLGVDALLLEKCTGVERLSELFCFRLDLLAERSVPFEQLLNKACSVQLAFPGCPERYIHGIVRSLTQGGRVHAADQKARLIEYHAELVPELWRLTRRIQSRIFLQQSVPQILQQVFKEWQLDVSWQLTATYAPRDRCVQYRESDFAFVSRLLEDEGIWYAFAHQADKDQLILCDNMAKLPALSGRQLIYDEVQGGTRPEGRITRWDKTQVVRSTTFTVRDHCFEMPDKTLQAQAAVPPSISAGTVKHGLEAGAALEVYDYPAAFACRFDGVDKDGGAQPSGLQGMFPEGNRVARLRMEEEAARTLTVSGGSNCSHLVPGVEFSLTRHFDGDGPYVLSAVEHHATLEGTYRGAEGAKAVYENRFDCLPAGVPFRPARVTPRPRVAGTQTATVVGPKGTPIFCDKYGRVKLLFRWDRQHEANGGSSGWVRVGQSHAGGNYGSLHVPRVGHDVIVDFLEGDPDQPIVVGSVYNGTQTAPFELPGNAAQSGFKSSSVNGKGSNFSGLMFDDTLGEEHVHLHGERHVTHSAESTMHVNTPSHFVNVGRFHQRRVGSLTGNNTFTTAGGQAGETMLPGTGQSTGSGSGGGSAGSSKPSWGSQALSNLATDYNLTVGLNSWNTFGMQQCITVGNAVNATFGPTPAMALLVTGLAEAVSVDQSWQSAKQAAAQGGKAGETAAADDKANAKVGAAITGFFGLGMAVSSGAGGTLAQLAASSAPINVQTEVVLGGTTSIHYGPSIEVTRGPKWEATRVLESTQGGGAATSASAACQAAADAYTNWMYLGLFLNELNAPIQAAASLCSPIVGAAINAVGGMGLQMVWQHGETLLLNAWTAAEASSENLAELIETGTLEEGYTAVFGSQIPQIAKQTEQLVAKLKAFNNANLGGGGGDDDEAPEVAVKDPEALKKASAEAEKQANAKAEAEAEAEAKAEADAKAKREAGYKEADEEIREELARKKATKQKAAALPDVKTGLGDKVDELVNKSPTLKEQLGNATFDNRTRTLKVTIGGRDITIRYANGSSSFVPDRGAISIDDNNDPKWINDPTNPNPKSLDDAAKTVVQTLAHELGHAADPFYGKHVDYNNGDTKMTKNEYVDGWLESEGKATYNHLQVRQEIRDMDGPNIGGAGNKFSDHAKDFKSGATKDQIVKSIGARFRNEEISGSGDPYGKTYEDQYEQKKVRRDKAYSDKHP